jgi:hypothetical protein
MRARNIKPDFFRDAELSELTIEARYLFIGLWCLADREGKLKDNPKQIRFEVFPETKTKENIENLINSLKNHNLLIRYEVKGNRYIKVVNFLRHQSPHSTEKQSEIPDPVNSREVTDTSASNKKPNKNNNDVGSRDLTLTNVDIALNPDSLIPESILKASSPAAPPFQEIIKAWNTHAPELLPRISLTESRKPKIKAAWKEHPDLEWFTALFTDISLSSWHSHRDRWQGCSFDWILKKRNEMREKLDAIKKSNGGSTSPGIKFYTPPDESGLHTPNACCPTCGGKGTALNPPGSKEKYRPCECLHPINEVKNGALPETTATT